MNDPLLVRGFKSFRDLLRDRQRVIERDRTVRDPVGKRRPLDKFHDQRGDALALLQAVDLRDVRMVKSSEDLGFALESSQPFRVSSH